MVSKKIIALTLLVVSLATMLQQNYFVYGKGDIIVPQDGGTYWEYWKIENVNYVGEYFGALTTCASTAPWGGYAGEEVTCSVSTTVSNRYYGELHVSIDTLSAKVGFDVTASYTKTAGYVAVVRYNGEYVEVFYGSVYDKYKVLQRKYIHIDGKDYPQSQTATVYALRWKRFYFTTIRRPGNAT